MASCVLPTLIPRNQQNTFPRCNHIANGLPNLNARCILCDTVLPPDPKFGCWLAVKVSTKKSTCPNRKQKVSVEKAAIFCSQRWSECPSQGRHLVEILSQTMLSSQSKHLPTEIAKNGFQSHGNVNLEIIFVMIWFRLVQECEEIYTPPEMLAQWTVKTLSMPTFDLDLSERLVLSEHSPHRSS